MPQTKNVICAFYAQLVTLTLIILSSLPIEAICQTETTSSNKGLFQDMTNVDGRNLYLLRGKTLTYDNGICAFFNQLLVPQAQTTTLGNTGVLNKDFNITECHFIQTAKTVSDVLQECNYVNLDIKDKTGAILGNNFEQPLVISGISGNLTLNGNKTRYLMISGSTHGNMHIDNDSITAIIHILKSRYNQVQLLENVFTIDSPKIHITDSYINSLAISDNDAKALSINFSNDSIGRIDIFNAFTNSKKDCQINELAFDHCKLNNILWAIIEPYGGKTSFRFNECSFGAESRLYISADTIEFGKCINIERGMVLDVNRESKVKSVLKFDNTDLTNIGFEYDDRYKLYKWPNPDKTRSIFENLLIKFRNENKLDSYKRIDIEYFQFRHSWFVNVLSLVWWNYGYNKWLIIYWTIFFLLLFSIINFYNWDNLILTYPVGKSAEIAATKERPSKMVKIFIYTAFIFFSLKVDFDKLSFQRNKWLVYFFTQYIIGLICLFFIANAILKL